MSSFYILADEKKDGLANPLKKDLDMNGFAINNLKLTPEENSSAVSKKYVDDENTSFLDLAGNRQMTGDLSMGDNSIVGIHDINADNSVVAKKYVDDKNSEQNTNINAVEIRAASNLLEILDMKPRVSTNKNNITSLSNKLDNLVKIYTYHFDFLTLDTSWSYPTTNAGSIPYHWMYCKGMTSRSRFHLHNLQWDNDSSLDSNFTFTVSLEFFDISGNHTNVDIKSIRIGDFQIPSERIVFVDYRYPVNSLSGYQNFIISRVKIKGSAVKGNEVALSCSFEI